MNENWGSKVHRRQVTRVNQQPAVTAVAAPMNAGLVDTAPMTWRRRAWESFLEGALSSASWLLHRVPSLSLTRNHIECIKDIPYLPTNRIEHTLDVYRPKNSEGKKLPVLLYIHGGGFQLLSKDSHWLFGSLFAQQGFVVFNVNYRLAPEHRYPSATKDVFAACEWVLAHAHEYNGDKDQLVLAGESAGANLALALTAGSHYEQTEPWARALWEAQPKIRAVIAGCGVLQVSDMARLARRRPLPKWLSKRLCEVSDYLPNAEQADPLEWPLADPLCLFEQAPSCRPLPPILSFVGTRDPLLDDTRRLHAALESQQATSHVRYYPGGIHAFHALLWQRRARTCWQEQFAFLHETLR